MTPEEVDMTKVVFRQVFPIAAYGINRTAEVEIQIRAGQTMEDLLDHAKERMESWHKKFESMLPERSFPVEIKDDPYPIKSDPTDEQFEALKKIIEDSPGKELAEKLLAKTEFRLNPELKEIIKNKKS